MSDAPLAIPLIANGVDDWIPTIVALFFGALGAILLLISVGFFCRTLWLLSCGRRVMATVAGYRDEEQEFHHDHVHVAQRTTTVTFHTPVFSFDDDNGRTTEAEGMGTTKKRFQKGERVALIYSPANPNTCVVDRFADKWVPGLVALLIAVVLLLFPVFVFFK